jgi:Na+-translocating ferredoxin:NAD+ oxidoreductase RNF subunit RnfB
MINVLYAVLVLGALGGVFGIVLAFAARVFAVEVDSRQEQITEALPGANCGGCGYAGCGAYAAAVVNDGAPVNACIPGGGAAAEKIASIMGVSAEAAERITAHVSCAGTSGRMKKKLRYVGIDDCMAAARLGGGSGSNSCPYGCLGFGDCVKACAFGAISVEDGVAYVDREKCTGCMACAAVCPKNIISKIPYGAAVTVPCSSRDKGADVRKYCDIGCISCGICEKACEFDAIKVTNGVAVIDCAKCTGCGQCALKCPRKLIQNTNSDNNLENIS